MTKKIIWAVLAVILSMMFAFSACGSNGDVTPDDGSGNGDNSGEQDNGGNGGTDDEYTLECPDGYNQITIYWNRASGNYSDCDVWVWYNGGDAEALAFHECEYGGKVIRNIPEDVVKVGYIVRTNVGVPGSPSWDGVSKDGTDSDRFVTLRGKSTEIYLKSGDGNAYESNDGGKTLSLLRYIALADMISTTRINVTMSDSTEKLVNLKNVKILDDEGKEVPIKAITNKNEIVMNSPLDVSLPYTLHIDNYDDVGVVPSTYFSTPDFEAAFSYDGELGVEIDDDKITFRLWAPTASKVVLNLYDDGYWGESKTHIALTRGDKGVWSYENVNKEMFLNRYYTYSVTTSMGTQEAVDPYARSAGLNGLRGMILDLDETDPDGWTNEPFTNYAGGYKVENYTDANIWEIHIRDFSNMNDASQYKGKYLAFTERGLRNSAGVPVGVDYLLELGVTHVHLLPSYDYASVDERDPDAQFNWGYDPQNYNVPEGSYATDAEDGSVRVKEYKQMVKALHDVGIGVIMDVVYNHTYSAESNLNKVVPNYYYRYNSNGSLSNGSGCGNETASERSMVKKYIVDSVKYWQSEYNLDGFRFDLMGLHDVNTMKEVEKEVHAKNPHALIYGEGWTGGTSTLPGSEQSTLSNIEKINEGHANGVAMFNDVIRDGVKGSVFNIGDRGFATGDSGKLGNVLFGVQGGYNNSSFYSGYNPGWTSSSPTNVINYVSAHDNNTLWDRICYVEGTNESSLSKRLAMNRLSAAIIQTSLGVPFMQAGEEMLRTKTNPDGSYNENSYNSSDEVNNLKWNELTQTSDQYKTMQYYSGLIAFRKANPTLRLASVTAQTCKIIKSDSAFVAFTITNPNGEQLLVVYNANAAAKTLTLPAGSWNLYINGTQAGTTAISSNLSGAQSIDGISCYVFKKA